MKALAQFCQSDRPSNHSPPRDRAQTILHKAIAPTLLTQGDRSSLHYICLCDRTQTTRQLHSNQIYYQYKHPTKLGLVTVPAKLSDDLAPGTLSSILKQAGLK